MVGESISDEGRSGGEVVLVLERGEGEVSGGNWESHDGVVGSKDGAERGVGSYGFTGANHSFAHTAVEGGDDFGVEFVAFGFGEAGFGCFDIGIGFAQLRNSEDEFIGFFGVAQILPVESGLFGAGVLLGEGGFGASDFGFGCYNGGFAVGGIEADEDISFFEEGSDFKIGVEAFNAS